MRLFKNTKKEKTCCNIKFEEIKEELKKSTKHSPKETDLACKGRVLKP